MSNEYEIIKLIPLFPLIGFLTIGLFGKYMRKEWLIGSIASIAVGLSFIFSVIIFISLLGNKLSEPQIVSVFNWIEAGNFSVNVSYQVDQLSILFSLIVTGVGFLIHIYSIGYMHGDRSFYRFFAYLNLFIFMMLNLVLASNFVLTFLGWEGVGLCSYLLIGFWYDRKFDGVRIKWTGDAANKAFIVNRIGDFGFLIAIFMIYMTFNTLDYQLVSLSAGSSYSTYFGAGRITVITILLFLGCTGKSAQIPLAVWLPDAMAGPTPVSALIHAATMVTAGVFLIARTSVLFALSPLTMEIVAIVGIATAFWAATIGIVQNDIKKILAYSTVSQLGFMFAALGAGGFSAGVFHVMTHAFFKGLLFLGAGSVIHGMHEEQNIKNMGGLRKFMPITYMTFFIATLAISGIPLFSGFFSKDEILWVTYERLGLIPWMILAASAFCTAFYMFRLLYLTFFGEKRFSTEKIHPHESPKTMTIPLMILAVLSAVGGFLGIPYILGFWLGDHSSLIHNFLSPVFQNAEMILERSGLTGGTHHSHFIEAGFMILSVAIALIAIWLAKVFYTDPKLLRPKQLVKNYKFLYILLYKKYFIDELYHNTIVDGIYRTSESFLWKMLDVKGIDGFVNGTAKLTVKTGEILRRIQTGYAQHYALFMFFGIIVILAVIIVF